MAMMAGCGLRASPISVITVLFGAWDSLSGVFVGTAWGALVIGALYACERFAGFCTAPSVPRVKP